MFEDANLFIGLDDASPETRLDTVEKLRASVRQGGGELWLNFHLPRTTVCLHPFEHV